MFHVDNIDGNKLLNIETRVIITIGREGDEYKFMNIEDEWMKEKN